MGAMSLPILPASVTSTNRGQSYYGRVGVCCEILRRDRRIERLSPTEAFLMFDSELGF